MSYITPATVQAIAHSLDIPQLSDEAAKALAPDVEYRLREIVQEALKFAKHARRTRLTTEDVNNALRARNVEPLYGFGGRDPARFVRASGHPDLFYLYDPERPCNQVIEAPLPPLPRDVGISAHWLAINGQQPAVPENAPVEQQLPKRPRIDAAALAKQQAAAAAAAAAQQQQQQPAAGDTKPAADGKGGRGGGAAGGGAAGPAADVAVRPPVRHQLSREHQVYFDRLVGLLQSAAAAELSGAAADAAQKAAGAAPGSGGGAAAGGGGAGAAAAAERQEALFRAALGSLATDPGIHPLTPYFSAYIADAAAQRLGDLPLLRRLLALARALLSNPAVRAEHYLGQLLPAVLTCLLTKTLGPRGGDEHWGVRDAAAGVAALAARRFGAPYHNVAPRLVRLMAKAFLDPSKGFACKYGAVVGLRALGPRVVRTALLPHIEPFVSSTLVPAMDGAAGAASAAEAADASAAAAALPAAERELRRREAQRLFSALVEAAGSAMYDRIIGLLADRLPAHIVMRRAQQPAGGQGWDDLDRAAALVARARVLVRQRPLHVRIEAAAPAPAAAGAGGRQAAAAGSGRVRLVVSEVRVEEVLALLQRNEQQRAAAAAGAAAGGGAGAGRADAELASLLQRQAPPPGAEAAARRRQQAGGAAAARRRQQAGGAAAARRRQQRRSVAEVLSEAWQDDSDVNEQLGALVHIFGEAVLAQLPLGELPCFNL